MSYLSLGLNLPARLGIDPWFVMKRAVAHYNATVSCASSDNSQQIAYEFFLINLCKSPKLITWTSTSTLQSELEVSEENSTKSATLSLPTQRKRPVRQQRLPKILISDVDCTSDTAFLKVDSQSNLINPTTSFIPLTEDVSANYHIFNELLVEHDVLTTSTPSLSTSELPSITSKSSRGPKRSLSKSQLFGAPVSKKSKPAPHWTEILDDLMTASDWEEAEIELQKEKKQEINSTSFNKTTSFIPLTEEESENFHIFNELLSEHTVSSISNTSLLTSRLPSITHDSQGFTTRSSISKKSKPTLHWTEILDNLMTASDWEEAEEESQKETDQEKSLEFMPLTSVESPNFDIFNELILEHQILEALESSTSSLATGSSSSIISTTSSSNSNPSKLSSKSFKDTQQQPHWSEILDSLMTDEDRQEADESLIITLPFSQEGSLECSPLDEIYSTPSSDTPSSDSSAQNTHALPTPVEELKDPFNLINNNNQNSYYHSDISFEIVKSCFEPNEYFSSDLSFNFEKSFLNLGFDFENSVC